ncbi:MAG TPA: hypothetical protein VFT64_04225 [Rickettsiales bacterium]|nr:hypothetical protein [Rickettsiales bacterium]
MPQLDPSSFPSQLFWLTVFFVSLYIVLARFLLPRVQSVIEVRASTIGSDVEQAERLQSEAERVRDIYEYALADAKAKSQAAVAEAAARIAATISKKQAELDAEIEKKLSDSEAGIQKAKQSVTEQLKPVATELAGQIVEALASYKPAAKDLESVVAGLAKKEAA